MVGYLRVAVVGKWVINISKYSIALITLLLLSLSSCTTNMEHEPEPGFHIEVTDDAGRAVTLDDIPERIISTAPSNTEILFALGLGSRVVGVTEYCSYPPEAGGKEKVGGFSTVNLERVIALEPDLVLASTKTGDEIIKALEELKIPIAVLNPKDIEGVLEDIELVGRLTGTEFESQRLVEDMEERIASVVEKTEGLEDNERPRVLYVIWHEPFITAGSETFSDDLIQKAGGINIARNLTGHQTMSLENIVSGDPQVIICSIGSSSGGHDPATLEYVKNESRFKVTSAVQNDRVYGIDSDIVSRGGPRIVDALEAYVRFIHPEE